MQQVFALAPEPRRAVWHLALALGSADLATQVRLARFAELAFLALGSTVAASVNLALIRVAHAYAVGGVSHTGSCDLLGEWERA